MLHDAASSIAETTGDTDANNTATLEQVLSSADPSFDRRGQAIFDGVMGATSGHSQAKSPNLSSEVDVLSTAPQARFASVKEHGATPGDEVLNPVES